MDYLVARVLKLLGVGHLGTTGWILVVVCVVVVAGLAGRLWDRKARNKASDRSGSKMPE